MPCFTPRPWNKTNHYVGFLYSQQEQWKQKPSSLELKNEKLDQTTKFVVTVAAI